MLPFHGVQLTHEIHNRGQFMDNSWTIHVLINEMLMKNENSMKSTFIYTAS